MPVPAEPGRGNHLMARRAPPCHCWRAVMGRPGEAQRLAEDKVELASRAGQTVVQATATDTWEPTKRAFARLLGHDDPRDEELAERQAGADMSAPGRAGRRGSGGDALAAGGAMGDAAGRPAG